MVPAVVATLQEALNLDEHATLMALMAAGGLGLVFLAEAGTFAGEEAGCQVEIGAAGAMGAAATAEAAGAGTEQALEAAAISLQNTLGMPCDLVRSAVEIPCHTRNAAAASSALVCADLILGGYMNPIPFEETVAASMKVGRELPKSLRCTSQGGLATYAFGPQGARARRVQTRGLPLILALWGGLNGTCGGPVRSSAFQANLTIS